MNDTAAFQRFMNAIVKPPLDVLLRLSIDLADEITALRRASR